MLSFFERLINPFPSEPPVMAPKTVFEFSKHYSKGIAPYLIMLAICSVTVSLFEVTLFSFLGDLVDWLDTRNPETFFADEKETLWRMGLLIALGMPIAIFLRSALLHQTFMGNYPMIVRWQAHRYLLQQSSTFYQNDFAGRIATKLLQTALAHREVVLKSLDLMLYVGVYFIGMSTLLMTADPRMLLPIIGWVTGYFLIMRYFLPRLSIIATRQADARSIMTGRIVDSYTNFSTVKLFSHAQREEAYAKQGMQNFLDAVYPQMRLSTQLNVSVWILNLTLLLTITGTALWLWTAGQVTAGTIAIAVSLCLRLNGMSQWIMWELSALFENIGTVRDGIKTISVPQAITNAPDAKPLAVGHGEIAFNQIHFTYDVQHQKPLFDGLSLTIKPGEKVGLVGRSGSGKSTLVNLLLRFYDIQQGTICIDGQSIQSVTQESLREAVGVVTQDTSLLHRSIRENIAYGRPDATLDEIKAAADRAFASEFIQDLVDHKGHRAYDAQVGERGVKLSGGQRQRISIARVLLKDAPILVLDEATSALDSEVEQAIQESFDELMQNKTVIAIAHRLSTIAAMDRLIVMDQGKIIEQGTHEVLIAQNGVYAQLWARQSGGFIANNLDQTTSNDQLTPA